MAFTVVVFLLVIVHVYSKAYVVMKSSLPVSLIRQMTAASRSSVVVPTIFVSSASRVACKSSLDSASCNHALDVGENQIVIRHLFKKVWDCELVVAIQHFPSDEINNSQSNIP